VPPPRDEALLAALRVEFPGLRVIDKATSRLHRAIDRALRTITLGRMAAYLQYHTTIGQRIYVAAGWTDLDADDRWRVLRHEAVHLRQFRRWTFLGMAALYLLVPLPFGLAWCRARFEQAAYAESIRASAELYGLDYVRHDGYRDGVLGQFTGPAYGWMWPFRRSLERWYDGVVAEIERAPRPW
jgi:hypothetical protein